MNCDVEYRSKFCDTAELHYEVMKHYVPVQAGKTPQLLQYFCLNLSYYLPRLSLNHVLLLESLQWFTLSQRCCYYYGDDR